MKVIMDFNSRAPASVNPSSCSMRSLRPWPDTRRWADDSRLRAAVARIALPNRSNANVPGVSVLGARPSPPFEQMEGARASRGADPALRG